MGRIGDKDREPDNTEPPPGMRILAFLSVLFICQMVYGADEAPHPQNELRKLVDQALSWHPTVKAAEKEAAAQAAECRAVLGFYDPTLYVTSGTGERTRSIPGTTGGYSLSDDAASVEGGVERPLLPGVYGGIGAGYHYLWNGDSGAPLVQNVIGGQVRIPLLRDRGFREFNLREQKALADLKAAESRVLAARQDLRHNVALAFISLYENRGLWEAARAATTRVKDLLSEAQQLVKLKVVPEYQLNQANLEVALRQEEEAGAREAYEVAREELVRLTGVETVQAPANASDAIIAWASTVPAKPKDSLVAALRRRGSWLNLYNQQRAAEIVREQAAETRKGDLSLRAGVSWQGESDNRGFGDETLTSEHHGGAYIQLVYSRPWGFVEADEKIAAAKARVESLDQQMQTESLRIENALNQAKLRLESEHGRLELATRAVALAGSTLTAEGERFRLGESLSRNVLDAQKDLTNTVRLQTRNAAGLLRAEADYTYHAGLPADNPQSTPNDGVKAP